ncbi:N-acetyltransferase, partial [Clostridium botulinum]|nr:N-acetyltransferase [Clostridium botulinum]
AKMSNMSSIKPNDNLVIYRTGDGQAAAYYRAVATTICTVEKIHSINSFPDFKSLKDFCKNYSIFTDAELKGFINSHDPYYVIKMTYNVSLSKRIIRGRLLDEVGMNGNCYWGLVPLTSHEFNEIIRLGEVNQNYII